MSRVSIPSSFTHHTCERCIGQGGEVLACFACKIDWLRPIHGFRCPGCESFVCAECFEPTTWGGEPYTVPICAKCEAIEKQRIAEAHARDKRLLDRLARHSSMGDIRSLMRAVAQAQIVQLHVGAGMVESQLEAAQAAAVTPEARRFVASLQQAADEFQTALSGLRDAIDNTAPTPEPMTREEAAQPSEQLRRYTEDRKAKGRARIVALSSDRRIPRYLLGELVRTKGDPHAHGVGAVETIYRDLASAIDALAVPAGWYEAQEVKPATLESSPWYGVTLEDGSVLVGEDDLEPVKLPEEWERG